MAARLIAVSGFALPIDGPTTVHDPDRHASISTSTAPGRGKAWACAKSTHGAVAARAARASATSSRPSPPSITMT
ncbi:MAG: hypothetical protein IPL75_13175 [Acidobacteria bacterium]|nr:hypothetical protein [Acidobacteriota bacterium]